jgi:hypothetical protein
VRLQTFNTRGCCQNSKVGFFFFLSVDHYFLKKKKRVYEDGSGLHARNGQQRKNQKGFSQEEKGEPQACCFCKCFVCLDVCRQQTVCYS